MTEQQMYSLRDSCVNDAGKEAKLLTPDRMSACSPRFLPDGSKLVFLSNEAAAETMTHMGTADLLTLDWPGTLLALVPCRLLSCASHENGAPNCFLCQKTPKCVGHGDMDMQAGFPVGLACDSNIDCKGCRSGMPCEEACNPDVYSCVCRVWQ